MGIQPPSAAVDNFLSGNACVEGLTFTNFEGVNLF